MEKIEHRGEDQPAFSVILPVYNQSKDVERFMQTYPANLDSLTDSWELIFIVNGSTDDTNSKLCSLARGLKNVQVFNLDGSGWGRAVKFGISMAKGKLICYTNSARTNVEDLVMMLKYAMVNDQIVIKANRIVRDSFIRKFGSTLYNFEFRLLYRIPVWDINGTPKVISGEILRELDLQEDGDLIDAELILKCTTLGKRFMEVPVVHTKRFHGRSTTNFLSAFRMYYGLLFLRKNL